MHGDLGHGQGYHMPVDHSGGLHHHHLDFGHSLNHAHAGHRVDHALMHRHMDHHHAASAPEPTQLYVEGSLMRLLAQSPDGTLMCCANDTQLKFVDSRFIKLYETSTPGPILSACFHPMKYELFLKVDTRTLIFDLATKEYRAPHEKYEAPIPPEPWMPPPPPPGAILQHGAGGQGMMMGGLAMNDDRRRSGSGRPKGSKDKAQRKTRSAAAQEFEKEVVSQLVASCGDDANKWNAKKQAIDSLKASAVWDTWVKAGLNEQQLVQFVHRLKSKRMGGKDSDSKPAGHPAQYMNSNCMYQPR